VEFHEAADVIEAEEKIARLRPALVILDLMLPGADGVTVCAFVKGNGRLKATRIIAMSGVDPTKARFDILSAGADGFLPKPFLPEDLAGEVRRLLPESFAA
jgi:DNA-binding response OmpR family regulator